MSALLSEFRRLAGLPRLLLLFLATVLFLLAGLIWLALEWSTQDQQLAAQRLLTERESAADLAVGALARALTQIEDARDLSPASLPSDSVLLTNSGGLWQAQPASHLAYLPALPTPTPSGDFAAAEAAEYSGQPTRSLSLLNQLLRSPQPAIRAGALLRIARLHRQNADWPAALSAYEQLLRYGPLLLESLPAAAIARQSRLSLFEQLGRSPEARAEAAALAAALASGAWPLNEASFGFYTQEAARLLPSVEQSHINAQRLALSALLQQSWPRILQSDRRQLLTHAGRSYLLLRRSSSFLLLGPAWLEQNWRAPLSANIATRGIALSLSTPEGLPVLPPPPSLAPNATSQRFAAATRLPWNVQAFTLHPETELNAAHLRRRILWLALLLISLLVFAGAVLIVRTLHRELAISRLQSDFVSAVSHEFRTPLTSLCQISELLLAGRVARDADRELYYGILARESHRLRRLVEGLLDFGRLEAGAREFRFSSLSLGNLAAEVAEDFSREHPTHAARLHVEAPPDTAVVRADPTALACVIYNLLDNATKYSPADTPIHLATGHDATRAWLSVRDQGPGIPTAEQGRIFDKFVRGEAARAAGIRGSGIGLALSRRIMESHHGALRLDSAPGHGSTFTLELPLAEHSEDQHA